jgi:hypothetical protein
VSEEIRFADSLTTHSTSGRPHGAFYYVSLEYTAKTPYCLDGYVAATSMGGGGRQKKRLREEEEEGIHLEQS